MAKRKERTLEDLTKPAPQEMLPPFPPEENECIEIHWGGPTPSGGDLSIAYFFNENGPCPRSEATSMNIVEYLKDGTRLNEHYGVLKH